MQDFRHCILLSGLANHQTDKLVDTTVCFHTGSHQYWYTDTSSDIM